MRAWQVVMGGGTEFPTAGHLGTTYSDIGYWDRLVQRGPALALAEIASLLDGADLAPDERALAYGAAGRTQYELGDLSSALESARAALDASTSSPRPIRSAVAMGVSAILAESGFVEEALGNLEQLAVGATDVDLARIRLQIAYVLQQAGRLNDALAEFDRCEALLGDGGAGREWVRVYLNRGLVLLQQGRLEAAESDFDRAESVADDNGFPVMAAQAVANLAVLHGRARRLVESVREFERAAGKFASVGNPARTVAHMEIDRAEVMMHSGLLVDARDASRAVLRLVDGGTNPVLVGDAILMVARIELAARSYRGAVEAADRAAVVLADTGRLEMVPHARSVIVQAGLETGRDVAEVEQHLAAAADVVASLRAAGWSNQADELSVARIRAARRWHLLTHVTDDIERLRAALADGQRSTALAGWWALAVARFDNGELGAAERACHGGLDVLDEIVAEAPTLEARSAAMRMGSDLSQLLIEVAIERGVADTVLAAAEGTRGRALHEELASTERHRPLTTDGAARLLSELSGRLGGGTLVEWLVVGDRVFAAVLDGTGTRLVDVGDRVAVGRACDRVVMWLDVAAAEPDGSSDRAMRACRLLDDLLIEPLGLRASGNVTMVPDGMLHRIPWSGLPSLVGRSVSITPNAQVWLESDRRAASTLRSVGLVVGPDLAGGDTERAAIDRWYPGAAIVSGAGATARTVRSMLAGSDLVHVAAHGRFRSDHPLLSTLRLHDDEATLDEAIPERVRSSLVVLSSCEGGTHGTADGSEVLGMSAVLLARGAAAVVAPLTAVRDLECAEFVVQVHRDLAAGVPVGDALALVRGRWLADDDLSRWAVASSFSCFGSAAVRVGG